MDDIVPPPPRYTGAVASVKVTGSSFAWDSDGPVLLGMGGSPLEHLAIFSTVEKLKVFMKKIETTYTSIKVIKDAEMFLRTVPGDIVIISDPQILESGKVRYAHIERNVLPQVRWTPDYREEE